MSLDILRNCPLFAALNAAQLAAAASGLRRQSLAAGTVLFHQNDAAAHYYIVEHGLIELDRLSPDGSGKVIELIGPGELFAEAVMFMNLPRYPVTARAVDDSAVLVLRNIALLDLLTTDNTLALHMLGHLSMRLHHLVQEIETLTLHDARYRLANYLLGECERRDTTRLTLPAPKQVIASRLGIKPETFSRLMHSLRSTGVIDVRGATLVVNDLAVLRNLLDSG
ncbi:Crp/Fnr family transcriptional regulator [Acidihalobacter ferrooxydans]|uniref:Crp/Fnr family transcriptional regulator n=1 Tax=Acidihalobacter ferrooxydans TaxID=1765967 RepID=A0A1P8UI64_9GAMM|nr:Crp/Fnr family transcriptional regulator [Acidihalobacter ferrooxydans]APZ43526.1 hypothetical protein BW247_10870 [Acidihalobacter ferrooxydans]